MDGQRLQGTYEGTFSLLVFSSISVFVCLLTACSRSGCQQLKDSSLKISFDVLPPTSTSATSHGRLFSLNQRSIALMRHSNNFTSSGEFSNALVSGTPLL